MSVFLRPPRFDQPAPSEITPRQAYEGRRDWLRLDEAYAPQMALRDRLIAGQPGVVHATWEVSTRD